MRRTIALIFFCLFSTTGYSKVTDQEAIAKFAESYGQAFESGQPEKVLAMVTDDFVALTPDKPAIVGKDAVRKELEADLDAMDVLELTFTHQETVVTGDWAYAWGRSKAKIVVDGTTIDIVGEVSLGPPQRRRNLETRSRQRQRG